MILFLLLVACTEKNSGTSPLENSNTEDTPSSHDTSTLDSTEWTEEKSQAIRFEIAQGICTQLMSCCDTNSQEQYFISYLGHSALSEYTDLLPPNAELSAEECPRLISEMLDKTWFGSWDDALRRGDLSFAEAQFSTCLSSLSNATCGEELKEELFNGTCFGFGAPEGGDKQRSYFARTSNPGASCQPIADGLGSLYYGNCDPTESFCCLAAEEGCAPFPIIGEAGICQAASQEGESCSIEAPLQLCATGLDCDYYTNICVSPITTILQQGETCYNPSQYEVLGDCENSWCDLFGTSKCEPLKNDGEECTFPESCSSRFCDFDSSTCSPNNFCVQ